MREQFVNNRQINIYKELQLTEMEKLQLQEKQFSEQQLVEL